MTESIEQNTFEAKTCLEAYLQQELQKLQTQLEAARVALAQKNELLSRMSYALNSTRLIMTDKTSRDYAKELCDEAAAALSNTKETK